MHTLQSWRLIYLQWLLHQGVNLHNVESNTPLGKKIIKDLESLPEQTPIDAIKEFFAQKDLRGHRIAIELPYHVDDVRQVTSPEDPSDQHFWIALADFIESKGGKPVSVDSRTLFKESHGAMEQEPNAGMKRHDRLAFRRSVRMVEAASFPHASYLIVGAGHSDDVKTVLGRDAQVTTLVPRALQKMLIPAKRATRAQWRRAKPPVRERIRARMSAARKRK